MGVAKPKIVKRYSVYTGRRFARVEFPDGRLVEVVTRAEDKPGAVNAWGDPHPFEETRTGPIVEMASRVKSNPSLVIYNPHTPGETPLEDVRNALQIVLNCITLGKATREDLVAVRDRLRAAETGLRQLKNPPFKLPRGGRGGAMTIRIPHVISDELVEIRYGFGGEYYKHEVETPTRLYAAFGPGGERALYACGKSGQPLWASDGEVQSGRIG